MDEATKQKVMIGIIVGALVLVLAINFWPESTADKPIEGEPQVRKVREDKPEERRTVEIRDERSSEEEEEGLTTRRRSTEEQSGASIRRQPKKITEQEELVPAA